jgi:hypothetical protein
MPRAILRTTLAHEGNRCRNKHTYTYKVLRPLTAYFVRSPTGQCFTMYFTVTPITPDT